MKEYKRVFFYNRDAEEKVNELAKDGWQIINIEEEEGFTYVWMERLKPVNPQLLQENAQAVHENNTWIVDPS